MRAIAREAGVSTGNAYYYFGSKDELIQEFYLRNHAEHAAACRQVLETEQDFSGRLRGTLHALIQVLNPYHAFAAAFYKNAAEPTSPLSPFSKESSPARDSSIALYRDVADGSSARIDRELRAELPRTAVAVLAGHRLVLGARHITGVRQDLPPDRRDGAAGRPAGLAGPHTGPARHDARGRRDHQRDPPVARIGGQPRAGVSWPAPDRPGIAGRASAAKGRTRSGRSRSRRVGLSQSRLRSSTHSPAADGSAPRLRSPGALRTAARSSGRTWTSPQSSSHPDSRPGLSAAGQDYWSRCPRWRQRTSR